MVEQDEVTASGAGKRRNKKTARMGIMIVAGIFLCIFVVQLYGVIQIQQEQHRVQQQLVELQQRNKELEDEKAKLTDPKYIESVARDELGLVRPGEVPYIK